MVEFEKLFSLKGKTAIITGASRGIGKVVAEYVAASGANLALINTKEQEAAVVASKISDDYGIKAIGIGCDIRSQEQVENMVDRCTATLGTTQLVFNNAGIVLHKAATECSVEEWNNVLLTNLTGTFLVSRAVVKRLISENKSGSIVNNASMMGKVVALPQRQAVYNASKAAVIHLSKSLAV